jgi:hypothetical protein
MVRGFVLSRAAILVAAAALVAGGCSGGGTTSGRSGKAAAASGKSFHQQVAPGFAAASQWTVDLPWAVDGFGRQSANGRSVTDAAVAADQASYGVAAVVGGTVVVPSFAPGGVQDPAWPTLQFLDAKTGKTIATRTLPLGSLLGVNSDMVAGKPVAVVRHVAAVDPDTGEPATAVTTVFDASGTQVWSSKGQPVSMGSWSAGLVPDKEKAPRFVGGHVVKLNPGTDTVDHSDASYDVLDTTGKSVLHIPSRADQLDLNHVSLVGGFAVVAHDDSLALRDAYTSHEHFTLYDLAKGATKIADVAEPDFGGRSAAGALATSNGKVLVAWYGQSGGGAPPTNIAVIDIATGTASAPATLFDDAASGLGVLVDAEKSDVVVYDATADPSRDSVVVSLSRGTVLWRQQDHNASLIPLSLHDGTLYGVEAASRTGSSPSATGSSPSASPGAPDNQVAVKEGDGFPAGSGYVLAPLAFTADGSPVFIEAPKGTASITIGVGRAS